MLTLTAPSPDTHREFDPGFVRGIGARECVCNFGFDLGEWNASAGKRWDRLRGGLSRLIGGLRFFRAVEIQRRGALHLHVLVHSSEVLDIVAVQEIAMRSGFGCVLDLAYIEPGSRKHAYYVSKYVTKSCDSREDVPWIADVVDKETGEIRRMNTIPTFRTWSSSRDWGLTMKQLRAVASEQAQRRAKVLRKAQEILDRESAGSLALESAGDVHNTGPPG